MRSAEVCVWAAIFEPAGTLKNTSTFGLAGSPCSTEMPQPSGRNGGQGPHLRSASWWVLASAGSTGLASVQAAAAQNAAASVRPTWGTSIK